MIHNSQQVFNDFTRFRMNKTRPAASGQMTVDSHYQHDKKNDEFVKKIKKKNSTFPFSLEALSEQCCLLLP